MRRPLPALALAAVLGLGAVGCSGAGDPAPPGVVTPGAPQREASLTDEARPALEVLATGLRVPWGLVVLDDGTALVGERDTARVWRVPPGGDPALVTTVPGVQPGGEGGLLGLAVPDGSDGSRFYAYTTTAEDNRVLLVEPVAGEADATPRVTVLLSGIPRAGNHNGGRLAFGPDGHLYVTTGDASDGALAPDPGSLAGKVLRVTVDGDPAPGNPDPGSPVWSRGHRNVQGLDWDEEGRLWASEFGQGTWDEVNLIEPGADYGWPEVEGPGGEPRFTDPVVVWPTSEASPSGLAVGDDGALYVAALRGQSLWRVPLRGAEPGEPERLLHRELGRLRSVVAGPDGRLWVLTSNTFRGDPRPDDDRLVAVTPP